MSKTTKDLYRGAIVYGAAARVKIRPRWWNWWNPLAWRKAKLSQKVLHHNMNAKYSKAISKAMQQAQRARFEATTGQKVDWDE